MTSPMGPGFFILFPPGERVLTEPVQIPLNLISSKSVAASVTRSMSITLKVAQKTEHSLKIIN